MNMRSCEKNDFEQRAGLQDVCDSQKACAYVSGHAWFMATVTS